MSYVDDLTSARDSLATELKTETAQRVTDQTAGRGVKTTYTANGRTVDWNGYLTAAIANLKSLDEAIAAAQAAEPWEDYVQGFG